VKYLKTIINANRHSNDPVTTNTSLVLSSNTNWGQMGFLLIKVGTDARKF